jgi:hypothetical protein
MRWNYLPVGDDIHTTCRPALPEPPVKTMRGAILYDKDRVALRVDFKIGLLISSDSVCPNEVGNLFNCQAQP